MKRDLDQWLAWIEGQHPQAVDLGLGRVREVAARMHLGRPARQVITVAGTNGKGSTVAFIEAIALQQGWRTGAYTSPHLFEYGERVRIDGRQADEDALVEAFEAVEAARIDGPAVSLTYFEFGTLAALWLFSRASLDLAILEVGLGGRLDATNIIDPDVAVITTVDLDHREWLGDDREAIGREKAGIARAWKPLVLGELDPPAGVLRHAYALGAAAIRAGCDFLVEPLSGGRWRWREVGHDIELPALPLPAPVQIGNAAAAIAALRALDGGVTDAAVVRGVLAVRLPARLQRVMSDGMEIMIDVGHNPQAAKAIAGWLRAQPVTGRTHAVYAALADKDVAGVVAALAGHVDAWHLGGLEKIPRGLEAATLSRRLAGTAAAQAGSHGDVATALAAAIAQAEQGDRILVLGSFHTAAAALAALQGRR